MTKLSERIRILGKKARPQWTEEELRDRSFFPEWADEVAALEQRVERFALAIDDLLDQPDGPGLDQTIVWQRLTDDDRTFIAESYPRAALAAEEEA